MTRNHYADKRDCGHRHHCTVNLVVVSILFVQSRMVMGVVDYQVARVCLSWLLVVDAIMYKRLFSSFPSTWVCRVL